MKKRKMTLKTVSLMNRDGDVKGKLPIKGRMDGFLEAVLIRSRGATKLTNLSEVDPIFAAAPFSFDSCPFLGTID